MILQGEREREREKKKEEEREREMNRSRVRGSLPGKLKQVITVYYSNYSTRITRPWCSCGVGSPKSKRSQNPPTPPSESLPCPAAPSGLHNVASCSAPRASSPDSSDPAQRRTLG